MRSFDCRNCGQLVFFENTACLHCEARLGFRWSDRRLLTLEPAERRLRELGGPEGQRTLTRCLNAQVAGCNWLVENDGALCECCELTRTRPADDDPDGIAEFRVAEAAKRRLMFELGELGLPIRSRQEDPAAGLAFDLLSNRNGPVTTGHADGVITIDLSESDDARREARRLQLSEPYRTMLGHLRHEVGHWYWTVLVIDDETHRVAREMFGDETDDYAAALERHYDQGPPPEWEDRFVSAYATMHPSEDWAETFAHYLHIRDTLQTAGAYGLAIGDAKRPAGADGLARFSDLLESWLPLTYALNAVNRSMGHDDLYPFVLSDPVVRKLGFVHDLVTGQASWISSESPSP